MGTFVTFKFKQSLYCPYCGKKHDDIQYSCSHMDTYIVGEKIRFNIFDSNTIRQEEVICLSNDCDLFRCETLNLGYRQDKRPFTYPHYFYIVIGEDHKYLGTTASLIDAEQLLGLDENNYTLDVG